MRWPYRWLTVALTMAWPLAAARAQTMVEVPTPPEVRQRIVEEQQAKARLLPPPSPSAPLPPPLLAAPLPIRTTWRLERRSDVVGLGVGLFGATYTPNLIAGLILELWQLDVPLVGPLFAIPRIFTPGGPDPGNAAWLAFDTLAQLGSVAVIVIGAVTKRWNLVRLRTAEIAR